MKILSLLLFIVCLFISSIKANSVVLTSIFKRDDIDNTSDNNTNNFNVSQACLEEDLHSEYSNECMSTQVNINNYKEKCSTFKSEKCQAFYNDPNLSKYYPICTQDEQSKKIFNPVFFQGLFKNVQSKCYTNESDEELCPLSLFRITQPNTPIPSYVVDDTCKSKKCTYLFIDYLNQKIKESTIFEDFYSPDKIDFFKQVVSQLESSECKSMHVTTSNVTSNAVTIIKGNTILLSLLLFLFLILLLY
ncbi:hypothetical protein PIROE2DRAFT_17127 [Piromyces sp. E2]|nr:hypothetical protein PIROE2DRAFT_17127 [Piromyces sp. E2]|eukprot:OUM57776.1 hypothetical protein PIROE2DRAFT_17127 [Piromyces sp. E2]